MSLEDFQPAHLSRADWSRARDALAAAFERYPMLLDVAPNLDARKLASRRLYGAILRDVLAHGQGYHTGQFEAVACWLPPGSTHVGFWRHMRSGMLRMLPALGVRGFRRLTAYDAIAQRLHRRHAPKRHWFLAVLGAVPRHQGQGFGARLLRWQLDNVAGQGEPVYLETHDPANVPLYEHFGFRLCEVAEGIAPRASTWAMLWTPGSQPAGAARV